MKAQISDPEKRLRFFIGDVRDFERLKTAFNGVDFIIHAAALKQVPALEYNPFEAIKTNILGTQNVVSASVENKVERVLLISTDKAANPANLYGATKLCAEKLMISANAYAVGRPTLSVVRYGNVFGSRGSLVSLIKQQKGSGEITLTHEMMTRFWMTLDQGVAFVLGMLGKMRGGEIFVPKIPSMKVKDMITHLAPECSLKIIGIRPGEKLHEVLITPEEARHTQEFDDHFVVLPLHDWWDAEAYSEGRPLPERFYFGSETNTQWLDRETLMRFVDGFHETE